MGRKHRARTFLLFFMVTRVTPGTGLTPSFAIAFRDFFSLRLCLLRDPGVPSSAQRATANAQATGRAGPAVVGIGCRSEPSKQSCQRHTRSQAGRGKVPAWCKHTARSMLPAWRAGTPPSSPSRAASSSSLDRSSESSLSRPCTEQAAEQRPPKLQASNTGKPEGAHRPQRFPPRPPAPPASWLLK